MRTFRSSLLLASLAVAVAMASAAVFASPVVASTDPPTSGGWRLSPEAPCVRDSVTLIVLGFHDTPCDSFIGVDQPGPVHVRVRSLVRDGYACLVAPVYYPIRVPLGRFAAGSYTLDLENELVHLAPDGTTHSEITHTPVDFKVSAGCPPYPGPLPYVSVIKIGPFPARGDYENQICPSDSISVSVSGEFPSNCFVFRRIELLPSPVMSPLPQPPTVRIIVDDRACLDMWCGDVPVPWSASARLGPLPARDYNLRVELARVTCAETYPPGDLFDTTVPFKVSDTCTPPPPCMVAGFRPPWDGTVCNASISPAHPAELTFLVRPGVALAGLEGSFRLDPGAFKVAKLEAIGPAAGMLLSWSPTEVGARFVLFAEHGAPIPRWLDAVEVFPPGWPVLKVTVVQVPNVPAPAYARIWPEALLGSDIAGLAVPLCPFRIPPDDPPTGADPRLAYPPGGALLCVERECDFNADGFEDVRDLVLMVHCVNGEGSCPPDAGERFDCDADKAFTIADAICCARHILRQPPCPGCPPDSAGVRPEPSVSLRFGAAVPTATGVDLPLHIRGADRLGAAMLTLDAPLDRYEVGGIDGAGQGTWLALHEVRNGQLVVGLVSTWSGDFAVNPNLDLTLHLVLKPGETPGGEVAAVQGEFSGGDGAMLAVNLGTVAGELPGPARLALGGNRPNPFSTETRFTLELTEGADVVVGVYDLRGRSVSTLFSGHLPPGPREFRWDGRSEDGLASPAGVYFYRVAAGGKTLSRKLILMRGN